jgi:RNA polymerase sigma factor (sigma-70 family)
MSGEIAQVIGRIQDSLAESRVGDVSDADLLDRYSNEGDQGAFTELVRRYGPLVLSVCGRILNDRPAAEDAFQATFLVLARKAGQFRRSEQLANWLFGVATRVARASRRQALRRRQREVAVGTPPDGPGRTADEPGDWRSVLHEEIGRLPSHYRAVILLCDLEGRTRRDAARVLGVPDGTLSNRLTRARALLGRRLLRRGVAPGGLFAVCAVPSALTARTVAAAFADHPPAPIASLATEVLRPMIPLRRLLVVSLVVCGVALLALGSLPGPGLAPAPLAAAPKPMAEPVPKPAPEPADPIPQLGAHVYQVAYSGDGRHLALAHGTSKNIGANAGSPGGAVQVAGKNEVSLVDTTTWDARKLTGPTAITRGLTFTRDGKTLFAACDDGAVYSWDVATGKAGTKLEAGAGRAAGIAISPDGKYLATVQVQGAPIDPKFPRSWVQLWDAKTLKPGLMIEYDGDGTLRGDNGVKFAPDGSVAAVVATAFNGRKSFDGVIEWDPTTGTELRRFPGTVATEGAEAVSTSLAFTPDGKYLIVGGGEFITDPQNGETRTVGLVSVFDRKTGKLHKTLTDTAPGYFMAVTLSADGKRLYAATRSRTVPGALPDGTKFHGSYSEARCWDTATWNQEWVTLGQPGSAWALAVAPNGTRVVMSDFAGVWLFDTKKGETRGGLVKTSK